MASNKIFVSIHIRWPWLVVLLMHLGLQRLALLLVRVDHRSAQSTY